MTDVLNPLSILNAAVQSRAADGAASSAPSGDAGPRPASAATSGFADLLSGALREADETHRVAEQRARELAQGEGDVVETMVALSKADLSLRLAVNIRNRALEAYNEIMRLPI